MELKVDHIRISYHDRQQAPPDTNHYIKEKLSSKRLRCDKKNHTEWSSEEKFGARDADAFDPRKLGQLHKMVIFTVRRSIGCVIRNSSTCRSVLVWCGRRAQCH